MKPPLFLVVCVGNMCRSPMAEAILRKLLAEKKIEADVISRGLAAPIGRRPHPFTIAVSAERGTPIAVSKHSALLTSFEVEIATMILVMEEAHRDSIARKYPSAAPKAFRIDHWRPSGDIADPVRSPKSAFDTMWDDLHLHCVLWAEAIEAGVRPAQKNAAKRTSHRAGGFFRLASRLGRLT